MWLTLMAVVPLVVVALAAVVPSVLLMMVMIVTKSGRGPSPGVIAAAAAS